ncbi:MAG: polysaccharide biosynthesis protein [Immundisolibacteraceae bacterium]|nr:polysaccharide biosynthesis protein [Immundisolibacteraceae bacterium]
MNFYSGKRVLVTGASGTVGSELIKVLLTDPLYEPAEVIGIDQNESELFFLEQNHVDDQRANFFVANIRDQDALNEIARGVDIILHAAALKHVSLCERSPLEAVQSNIVGVENVISAALKNNVSNLVFTSSDKAVNPTNVMGTSKLMGERLITAANSRHRGSGPVFSSTRFGNVLGSSGSVIPIFHKQIALGGPVTLTDSEMTRFIMSVDEAVRLVLDSVELARGGEVFITKMPVARIEDIAQVMIAELAERYGHQRDNIEIKVIGSKPGEKLYEELMSHEEIRRSVELEQYFSVLPAFRGLYRQINYQYDTLVNSSVSNPYISSEQSELSRSELKEFLIKHDLLAPDMINQDSPSSRQWPGDK